MVASLPQINAGTGCQPAARLGPVVMTDGLVRQDGGVEVNSLYIERPSPLTKLRIWRGGGSPVETPLPDNAVIVEWAGQLGHPTSYALLGLSPRRPGVAVSLPTDKAKFEISLADGLDEVTWGELGDAELDAIREVLGEDQTLGWEILVAASGRVGSSPAAFRWVARFIRNLYTLDVTEDASLERIWATWDDSRPW